MIKGLAHPSLLTPEEKLDIEQHKYAAWLAYFWLGSLYIYIAFWGKSPYLMFHARQGLCLALLFTFFWVLPLINIPLGFLCMILGCYGIAQAHAGQYSPLPLIGTFIAQSKNLMGIEQLVFRSLEITKGVQKARAEIRESQNETDTDLLIAQRLDGEQSVEKPQESGSQDDNLTDEELKAAQKPQWE